MRIPCDWDEVCIRSKFLTSPLIIYFVPTIFPTSFAVSDFISPDTSSLRSLRIFSKSLFSYIANFEELANLKAKGLQIASAISKCLPPHLYLFHQG